MSGQMQMISQTSIRLCGNLKALVALALLAGCEAPKPAPPVATQPAAAGIEAPADAVPAARRPLAGPELPVASASVATEPLAEPAGDGQLVEETWDALSIKGSRVGYTRTRVATVEVLGQPLLQTEGSTQMTLNRDGQTIVQDMLLTSWETPSGLFVRCESRMKMGPGDMISQGHVEGQKLIIETKTLGKTQSQTIPWPAGSGGYFAVEQSLRQKPLTPGEKRSVSGLVPVFNIVGTTELAAADYETVKLPTGEQRLLKVNSIIDLGGQKMETTVWIDDRGQTLKSLVPAIGQESVRTTKEDALRKPGENFDLLVASVVKLRGKLPNPLTTKRVVYRATAKRGKIAGVFPQCLSQRVLKEDEPSVELLVQAVRPQVPKILDVQIVKPTDADLAASNMIQSDDPRIVEMAAKAAPMSDDSWATALALEKFVAATIKEKNYRQAFATAAEVAQSLEGDCTEHAMLLAALCRARKIPARAALGLVYYPPQQGFAFHMWNEVWIGDRWIGLDGTLGRGGIGADHIKLGDSDLSSGLGLTTLLPVVNEMGRLELEVVAAE